MTNHRAQEGSAFAPGVKWPAPTGESGLSGTAGAVIAQDNGVKQPSAREQLQQIDTLQSIDQQLARITNDLELTADQQRQVRSPLEEHHDMIQALLDKSPTASRQDLSSKIHGISDETHSQIHAPLTDHQKGLEKAIQQRAHNGKENRRPAPDPFLSAT